MEIPFALIPAVAGVTLATLFVLWIFSMRQIVDTNTVHIVQSGSRTTSYGSGKKPGNAYLRWPSFLPILGVNVIKLPVNNFDLTLREYNAFDKDRVPFLLDITAFFRIEDTTIAATRIASFEQLKGQLTSVVQGAARKILATHDINTIMLNRSTFGDQFTSEVAEQLLAWGVVPVKNIELMDIKDHPPSQVIHNIMAKKISHIDMESRTEVAANRQKAAEAEIIAQQEVDLRKQDALRLVGERTAQQEQNVGIAKEKGHQAVQTEAKTTKQRQMDVLEVEVQRKAEIGKNAAIVGMEQERQTTIIQAEGQKQRTILDAEAELEKQTRAAKAVELNGAASAEAAKLLQLAPVEAQIVLAKEIGANDGYQTYLIKIREVEAMQAVGIEQAGALEKANIKIIANAGSAASGIASLGEVISSKGGQQIGAMLEGLAQTDEGKAMLSKFSLNGSGKPAAPRQ